MNRWGPRVPDFHWGFHSALEVTPMIWTGPISIACSSSPLWFLSWAHDQSRSKKKGIAEFFLGLLGTGVHMALWPTESHLRISRGDPQDKADSKKRETEKRNQDPLVNVLSCIKIMPFGFSVSKTNTSFAAWARLFFFVWFGFLIVWLQTMVLKKTSESPLDSKGIKPINPTGNQLWIFIERTGDEAEAPKLWPPEAKSWFTGKDPDAGQDWRQEEKGTTEDEMVGWHHWLDMSLSKLQEVVKDREALCAAFLGVTKSQTWLTE